MPNTVDPVYSMDSTKQFVSQLCKEEHSFAGDDSLFYFETDFLPLKGNTDYLKLIKTLAILEVQRMKVFQDINELRKLKLKAVEDPYTVKEQIMEGKLACLSRCNIEEVPDVDLSKYHSIGRVSKKHLPPKRKTRHQAPVKEEEDIPAGTEIRVRGRLYTDKKPQTFNQLWTVEEQLKLEQLLSEIPPEPVEYRRWEKIAEGLGNRTPQQVCSRVQKYFEKLEKAGITAPKHKQINHRKRAYYVQKQHKHFLYKPSTFFPGSRMGELEETDSEDSSSDSFSSDLSHWTAIYKKINEDKDNELKVEHIGFKCEKCRKAPIVGTRWECKSCPRVSFCSDCMLTLRQLDPPPHPVAHHFTPVELFNNTSYGTHAFSCENYLDPNAHLS